MAGLTTADSHGHDGRGQVIEALGVALEQAALYPEVPRAMEDARRERAAHADVGKEASGPTRRRSDEFPVFMPIRACMCALHN